MREYCISEIEHIKVNGRTTMSAEGLNLFWTGSGFELNAKCSELWVEIEAGYDVQEPWFAVLVNGVQMTRQMAYSGKSKICLFRNMNPEEVKHVQFVKEVQAMSDDCGHFLQIQKLFFDGELLPVPNRKYKLEFVGDSITSGEGTIGATQEMDWISMFFTGVNHYAFMTGSMLDADYRIVSQSGWGTLTDWEGNPRHAIPKYYTQVCGLLHGEHNRKAGALEEYDFSGWQPDAVVINLGTNDESAFRMPPYTDPDTNETFQQKTNPDGSFCEEDVKRFEQAVIDFLTVVREKNPSAKIVWVYGMLGYGLTNQIVEAIIEYQRQSGDRNIYFRQLPKADAQTIGAREHPGAACHKLAAQVLTELLRELL